MRVSAGAHRAQALIDTAYLEGGIDPSVGLDCYGLVREAMAAEGVTLPETAAECLAVFGGLGRRLPASTLCRPMDVIETVAEGRTHLLVAVDAIRAVHATRELGVAQVRIAALRRGGTLRAVLRPRLPGGAG